MTNKRILLIILLLTSALVHFLFFGHPSETVFDEVHFGKFVSGYSTHKYYFDIHPPLGKLLIAGMGRLFDFRPEFSFAEIGQEFPDNTYLALRFLPILAGTLFPIIVFLLCLKLGIRPIVSFLAGLFIVFENALLVQSRSILLDLFLLDFGFLALYFYLRYRASQKLTHLIYVGVFGILAGSVKWTGLSFLALPFIIEAISFLRKKDWKKIWRYVLAFMAIPFLIYFSVFWVHFSLLSHSGEGDAFMSPEFRKTLVGTSESQDPNVIEESLLGKFTELNIEMYRANQRLTTPHSYGSQWYTWPFMIRGVYYWNSDGIENQERIYLLGNPILWWATTLAIVFMIGKIIAKEIPLKGPAGILLGGYFINLLPFIGIGRVMFLYHYFPALVFSILILAWLFNQQKNLKWVYAFTVLVIISFVYFSPLSYGLSLSNSSYEQHNWLESWK